MDRLNIENLAGERDSMIRESINRYLREDTETYEVPLYPTNIEGNTISLDAYVIKEDFDAADFLKWAGEDFVLHIETIWTPTKTTFVSVEVVTRQSRAITAKPGNVIVRVLKNKFAVL